MGVAALHWDCRVEHTSRRGYRKDRLHDRTCQVAAGHEPGTISIECRTCRRGYTKPPRTGYRVLAAERHYDCPLGKKQHDPPLRRYNRTGHQAGCPTKPNHTGEAGFDCEACRNLYQGRPENHARVGRWDSHPHWACELAPADHPPVTGKGRGHRVGCGVAEGHDPGPVKGCSGCHELFGRERLRAITLRKYNITREEYLALLEAQDGGCAICGREPDRRRELAVDHDHSSGLVRGLLCHRCNLLLGNVEDDTELLLRAAKYLKG